MYLHGPTGSTLSLLHGGRGLQLRQEECRWGIHDGVSQRRCCQNDRRLQTLLYGETCVWSILFLKYFIYRHDAVGPEALDQHTFGGACPGGEEGISM